MALALEVPAHPANRAGPHRWISRTFAPQGHISSYKPGPAGGLRPGNDTTVTEGEGASLTRRFEVEEELLAVGADVLHAVDGCPSSPRSG